MLDGIWQEPDYSLGNIDRIYTVDKPSADGSDDSLKFQEKIDLASANGGGVVVVGEGTYNLNLERVHKKVNNQIMDIAIEMRDNVTLLLHPNAFLKAMPNAINYGVILAFISTNNTNVIGGQFVGDRERHVGSGQDGYAFNFRSAKNVLIKNATASEFFGDGAMLTFFNNAKERCENILFEDCVFNHNRRQGVSIVSGTKIYFNRCTFSNTIGTAPESGVDIEPDGGSTAENIYFKDCIFEGNEAEGLKLYGQFTTLIRNVTVDNCVFKGNKWWEGQATVKYNTDTVKFINSTFVDNVADRSMEIGGAKSIIINSNIYRGGNIIIDTANGTLPVENVLISDNIIEFSGNEYETDHVKISASGVTNVVDNNNIKTTV